MDSNRKIFLEDKDLSRESDNMSINALDFFFLVRMLGNNSLARCPQKQKVNI